MKKIITIVITTITTITIAAGQCTSLFSFTADSNKVSFINQSSISNAHYFWNFGDGTGSNYENPVHIFPGNGNYLVTLFAEDTVSKCSSYYEYWVDVIKDSNAICQLSIYDSLYTSKDTAYLDIYKIIRDCNNSMDVGMYDVGYFQNLEMRNMPIRLGNWQNIPFEMVCKGIYFNSFGQGIGNGYKTIPYQYSSSHNYGGCSANFEFTVVSKDSSGERILFTAMNKSAKSYEWSVYGFGNPINSSNDTVSQFYPYTGNLYVVGLNIQGLSGCHDTIYQNIVALNSVTTVLGVSEVKDNIEMVSIYPNPSNGVFALSCHSERSEESNPMIEVYNVLGEKVYSQFIVHSSSFIVNLSAQPNGVYFYRVLTENGEFIGSGKAIIQR